LEILQQLPDVDAVFLSVGGGGLIAGVGAYLKAVQPNIKVF
jgi:threonine dehydratase